jgi:hypothetical protein
VRNLSPATQQHYIAAVAAFAQQFHRSPEVLEASELNRFAVIVCDRALRLPPGVARGSLQHWMRLFPQTTNPTSKEPSHDTASPTHD